MWVAEIAAPGIINASKRNTRPWSNFEKQKNAVMHNNSPMAFDRALGSAATA
jgi:hypothetical protein